MGGDRQRGSATESRDLVGRVFSALEPQVRQRCTCGGNHKNASARRAGLRDYLARATPDNFILFADGLLTALEADPAFSSAGAALRRHGLPQMNGLSHGQDFTLQRLPSVRAATELEGTTLTRARTTMLSMYRSKGREFDFVVLVVEPRDHSQKVTTDELRRLYYPKLPVKL
ncbi:MAG: hypothetical protein ACYDDH_04755 [Candidatus Desulforudaceae bacterium]